MDAFAEVVGIAAPAVHDVTVGQVRECMTLAADVRSASGILLARRAQRVSDQLIERLLNVSAGLVADPLRIFDDGLGA